MQLTKFFALCAIGLALFFGSDRVSAQTIYVREIRVTGERDGFGALEVEVHMYWRFSQDSVRFLGCSGQNQGLRNVDVSDIHYVGLSGFFQKPAGGNLVSTDIANKNIYLITSEDDVNPCPVEYGGSLFVYDDLIGQSEIFNGNQLANLKAMTFGRVKSLLIGAGDYTRFYKLTDQSQVIGNRALASNGGCWGDFDNDGDPDLFIPNGRGAGATNDKNQLLLNRGDGTFQEVRTGAVVEDDGNSTGCTCADYDNDGDVDLFVTNEGPNFLYANDGRATFTKITTGPVVTDNLKSAGAAWGDYDNDGDLDLFVATKDHQKNALYLNLGGGRFTKADSTNIVVNEASNSTGCNWVDYDGDGDVDLFVTNTDNQRNFLYRNFGGRFEKITSGVLVTDNKSSLGASWADYDNDGDLDVLVVNGKGQRHDFYTNSGGNFSRQDFFESSASDTVGIGSSWGDFDNDGDPDLFTTTSYALYINQVSQGEFLYPTVGYGVPSFSSFGRSGSMVDYDGDGALDFFAARFRATNWLYHNDGGNNNWLKVRCKGLKSNRSAIGAKVRVKARINGKMIQQVQEISAQTGHSAQNSLEAHFGLGTAPAVDSLIIRWPAGGVEVLTNLAANRVINLTEDTTTAISENVVEAPITYALEQNHPNPFNPSTMIKYALSKQVTVKLEIFDMLGRHVRTLVNQLQQVGHYAITWDGRNEQGQAVASGTFLYQLRAVPSTGSGFVQTQRMALVR